MEEYADRSLKTSRVMELFLRSIKGESLSAKNLAEEYNVFYYYDSKTNSWKIEIFDYDMELVDSFHVEDKYLDKTLCKLKTIFKINLIE